MEKLSKKKIISLALALVLGVSMLAACDSRNSESSEATNVPNESTTIDTPKQENNETTPSAPDKTASGQLEDVNINLGSGMKITDIGSYTGLYMEDGSDEIVSDVLMVVVTNTGNKAIQYADIKLSVGEEEAKFELSTLPAGKTIVLLEQNRMVFDNSAEYTSAIAENVALFSDSLSLKEDQVKLQILDGAINVTNVANKDIAGDIVIYYKNSASDLYYGGITYRTRIEGGLSQGEIRQVMGNHLSKTGTEIMFVTIG